MNSSQHNKAPNFRLHILLALLLITAFLVATWRGRGRGEKERAPGAVFAGETMGTTYQVRLTGAFSAEETDRLEGLIAARLREVNAALSTYDPESEISRFNRLGADEIMTVSEEFFRVMRTASNVWRASGGAFDPTVGALVNLWGFGPDGRVERAPDASAIRAAMESTGFQYIRMGPERRLSKVRAGVTLNLGAVAKGYGADALADMLRERAITNYMVEIGGEVAVSGRNQDGVPWRIGIEMPARESLPGLNLYGVAHITEGGLATSGDYRNYFRDEDGRLYTHILDPAAGRPVRRAQAGVSVTAPDCAAADAWATALFVMGPERGLETLRSVEGIEALFLQVGEDGQVQASATAGFVKMTGLKR